MENRTFAEIINALSPTEKRKMRRRLYDVTGRSENTVYRWTRKDNPGYPDTPAQKIISQELGIPAEVLFPPKD